MCSRRPTCGRCEPVYFHKLDDCLGRSRKWHPMDESNQFNLRPQDWPYAHSKHLAEKQVLEAVKGGLQAVILNPSIIIGPRDLNQISGAIIVEAAKGRLRFFTPGGQNYVDVGDVVTGHINAAERGSVGERYLLGGENITVEDMFTTVCEIVGRPRPRLRVPGWILPPASVGVRAARKLFGNRVPLDPSQVRIADKMFFINDNKAVEELALPQTPLREAAQRAFDWYNDNGYLD